MGRCSIAETVRGKKLKIGRCSRCHTLSTPHEFQPNPDSRLDFQKIEKAVSSEVALQTHFSRFFRNNFCLGGPIGMKFCTNV